MNIVMSGTPTSLTITPQFSDIVADTEWYDYIEGDWPAVANASIMQAWPGNAPGQWFRLKAIAIGTTSANKFTATIKAAFYT